MIEIKGDAWSYYCERGCVLCITTNGFVKKNGEAVMGRGIAAVAKKIVKDTTLSFDLGYKIKEHGNIPHWLDKGRLLSFPVKHNWWEKADIELIKASAQKLMDKVKRYESLTFILPRPGCGNGKLQWEDVKKAIAPILKSDRVLVIHNG